MKLKVNVLMLFACLLLLPVLTAAQENPDTVLAEVAKIDNSTWSVTVSCTNSEDIVGLTVPFKMSAGMNKIVADSAVYTGGRVMHFNYRGFRADTAIQCVTLGMVANLGPSDNKLTPGTGRLVTVFVSSLEDKPIENLTVDTTTTEPTNSLLLFAHKSYADGMVDATTTEKAAKRSLVPAWVVRKAE